MFLPFALGVIVGAVLAVKLGYRLPARTLLAGRRAADRGRVRLVRPDQPGRHFPTTSWALDRRQRRLRALPRTGRLHRHRRRRASRDRYRLGPAQQLPPDRCRARTGRCRHVAQRPQRASVTPEALNDGYALGLALSAALLVAAVLIALTVLRRTSPPARAGQTNDPRSDPAGTDPRARITITRPRPVSAGAVDRKGAQSDD